MSPRIPAVDAPDAFRQQLVLAIPRVRRYARSLVYDVAAADDLTQTALERALAHWHQFDQQRDLVVWVLSIVHNAHLDLRRRDGRTSSVDPQELDRELERRELAPGNDVGLRMDLLAALSRLSPEHREPLLLVGVEQYSYAEAAEVLRIPVGTVMSRVSRARVALRRLLDGEHKAAPALRRVI